MRRGRNRWHKFIQAKLSAIGSAIEIKIVADGLTEEEAFAKEIERIAFWKNDGADLVNQTIGGEGTSGRQHTEEEKRNVSAKLKGKVVSAETRAKLSTFMKGRQHGLGKKRPRYAVEASAAAQRGIPHDPATIELLRQIRLENPTFKGKTHTAEWRENMRALQVGIPKSEETKARMRKPKSEAHKQKLRDANLGKTHTSETRAKLSEIAKADWARRKAKAALKTEE
jgi:hypothetical protein